VLICFERKVLLADCWWLVCSERKVLLAVADKPNEQGVYVSLFYGVLEVYKYSNTNPWYFNTLHFNS
jgi:hypothetical protein